MERKRAECGDPLTALVETNVMVPAAGGKYVCSSCQLAFKG